MAIIDIPTRICCHCGGTRWKIEHSKNPTKSEPDRRTIRYRCPVRAQERNKRWNNKNVDYLKEFYKERDAKKRASGYYKTEKVKAYCRAKEKEYCTNLADKYVRSLWRKKHENREYTLTPEEMEIYKQYLITHRQLKQLNNGKETNQNS